MGFRQFFHKKIGRAKRPITDCAVSCGRGSHLRLFVPLDGENGLLGLAVEVASLGHVGVKDDIVAMLVDVVRIDAGNHTLGGRGGLKVDFGAERLATVTVA